MKTIILGSYITGYFSIKEDMSIKNILTNWSIDYRKGEDPIKKLKGGAYYHGNFKVVDLMPYRDHKWSKTNNRMGNEKYQELKEDIKKNGFTEPVMMIAPRKGKPYLGEGNHRLAIAKELGLQKIPVKFVFYQRGK